MMVLVDSSVWIDFLRQPQGNMPALEMALHDGRAAIRPVVWVELWSGVRSKSEESVLKEMRELCLSLEVDAATWERAADLSQVALRHGLNCPLADVLIVACAKRHGAELLYRDQHIDQLLALAADAGANDRLLGESSRDTRLCERGNHTPQCFHDGDNAGDDDAAGTGSLMPPETAPVPLSENLIPTQIPGWHLRWREASLDRTKQPTYEPRPGQDNHEKNCRYPSNPMAARSAGGAFTALRHSWWRDGHCRASYRRRSGRFASGGSKYRPRRGGVAYMEEHRRHLD